MPRILFADNDFPDIAIEREICERAGVELVVAQCRTEDDVIRAADGACGILLQYAPIGRKVASSLPGLGIVSRIGAGFDTVDTAACAEHGIWVANSPDYGVGEVATHALAMALALVRNIVAWNRDVAEGRWHYTSAGPVRRASNLTLGIVGLGRIGTAAALRAKAFQFRVVAYDPYMPNGTELGVGGERVRSLEALMEQTDTLSIHAPLTLETRGMISRAMLERMPKGGVVVSTARGTIVDVEALADLLKRGHLAGIGLDVLPVEPPVEPVPELLRAYRAREPWCEGRLIITPHSAFFTPEAWDDIRLKSAETMRAAMVGPRPQNVITPEMF